MATLDDKLLGEKSHYYCSSSEDEEEMPTNPTNTASASVRDDWQGYSTNTGPKGVIQDFQRWKQLESEKRTENELERIALARRLNLSCQTEQEEQKEREKGMEEDLLDSNDDPVLQEFVRKRMEEMVARSRATKKFGSLFRCTTGTEFLNEIENEAPETKIICGIYSLKQREGNLLTKVFEDLAKMHPDVKFVAVSVSAAGMSAQFEEKGCPSILVYRQASLIGNFVRITDSVGKSFLTEDVEGFLVDHGFLSDAKCVPDLISCRFRDSKIQDSSSDED